MTAYEEITVKVAKLAKMCMENGCVSINLMFWLFLFLNATSNPVLSLDFYEGDGWFRTETAERNTLEGKSALAATKVNGYCRRLLLLDISVEASATAEAKWWLWMEIHEIIGLILGGKIQIYVQSLFYGSCITLIKPCSLVCYMKFLTSIMRLCMNGMLSVWFTAGFSNVLMLTLQRMRHFCVLYLQQANWRN